MWLTYFFILHAGNRRIDLNMDRRGIMRLAGVFGLSGGLIGLGKFFPSAKADSDGKEGSDSKKIVKLERLPVGGSFKFKANGNPAMVFRTKSGVFAYSLVCTHQGCVVDYSRGAKQLICPCHGAAFDPFNNAKVLNPPAPRPLPKIKVKISGEYVIFA
jgi:thiosulfate dehydrogenase [quinone] large subunit